MSVDADGTINIDEEQVESVSSTIIANSNDFVILEGLQIKKYDNPENPNLGFSYTYDFDTNINLDWIEVSEPTDDGVVTLSVKANETEEDREAIVVLLPRALAEECGTNYNDYLLIADGDVDDEGNPLDNVGDLKPEFNTFTMASITQNAETVVQEGISFEPFIYSYEVFMSLEDFYGQDPSYKDYIKIENVSGTSDASNELGISNVWKITCSNMLTTSDMSLAIQANGLEANDLFGAMSTPDGVTINNLNKDGNTLVNVVAPNYIGEFEFIVMGSDESLKALLKIEITGN